MTFSFFAHVIHHIDQSDGDDVNRGDPVVVSTINLAAERGNEQE